MAERDQRAMGHARPIGGRMSTPDLSTPRDDWDAKIAEAIAAMGPPCEHEFGGWREFEDGRGGEQFCQKCGYGAMAWTLRLDI